MESVSEFFQSMWYTMNRNGSNSNKKHQEFLDEVENMLSTMGIKTERKRDISTQAKDEYKVIRTHWDTQHVVQRLVTEVFNMDQEETQVSLFMNNKSNALYWKPEEIKKGGEEEEKLDKKEEKEKEGEEKEEEEEKSSKPANPFMIDETKHPEDILYMQRVLELLDMFKVQAYIIPNGIDKLQSISKGKTKCISSSEDDFQSKSIQAPERLVHDIIQYLGKEENLDKEGISLCYYVYDQSSLFRGGKIKTYVRYIEGNYMKDHFLSPINRLIRGLGKEDVIVTHVPHRLRSRRQDWDLTYHFYDHKVKDIIFDIVKNKHAGTVEIIPTEEHVSGVFVTIVQTMLQSQIGKKKD